MVTKHTITPTIPEMRSNTVIYDDLSLQDIMPATDIKKRLEMFGALSRTYAPGMTFVLWRFDKSKDGPSWFVYNTRNINVCATFDNEHDAIQCYLSDLPALF